MANITITPYFKSGDDFASYLKDADTVQQALAKWAEDLHREASNIQWLGKALDGRADCAHRLDGAAIKKIKKEDCTADTRFASISVDARTLAVVKKSQVFVGCVGIEEAV